MKYAAFDIETTGLDPKTHRVIELALALPDATHSWLINPGIAIPEKITEITGITQEMADGDGVPFFTAWQEFLELTLNIPHLIGHNALNFDAPFLRFEELRYFPCTIILPVIDTAALYKGLALGGKWWPPRQPHAEWAKAVLDQRVYGLKFNLGHAAKEMGVEVPEGLHRVGADAALTLKLFERFLEQYPEIEEVI